MILLPSASQKKKISEECVVHTKTMGGRIQKGHAVSTCDELVKP